MRWLRHTSYLEYFSHLHIGWKASIQVVRIIEVDKVKTGSPGIWCRSWACRIPLSRSRVINSRSHGRLLTSWRRRRPHTTPTSMSLNSAFVPPPPAPIRRRRRCRHILLLQLVVCLSSFDSLPPFACPMPEHHAQGKAICAMDWIAELNSNLRITQVLTHSGSSGLVAIQNQCHETLETKYTAASRTNAILLNSGSLFMTATAVMIVQNR